MNLLETRESLIKHIEEYLNGKESLEVMRNFSWDIIGYFSKKKGTELPEFHDFEKEFWYAIWEIQHLADENHENEGVTKRTLLEALDYLKNNKKIPIEYEGLRP